MEVTQGETLRFVSGGQFSLYEESSPVRDPGAATLRAGAGFTDYTQRVVTYGNRYFFSLEDPGLNLTVVVKPPPTSALLTGISVNDAAAGLFLASLATSTNPVKGYVRLSKHQDIATFLLASVSDVSEDSGVYTLEASYVSGASDVPFVDGELLVVSFARSGDIGPPGPASQVPGPSGPQGVSGLQGPPGLDSNVPGPIGPTGPSGPPGVSGPASTVPGPSGPRGEGISGPPGPASTVPGPAGPAGQQGVSGPTGAASTVPGPSGPPGESVVGPSGPPGPSGSPGSTLPIAKLFRIVESEATTHVSTQFETPSDAATLFPSVAQIVIPDALHELDLTAYTETGSVTVQHVSILEFEEPNVLPTPDLRKTFDSTEFLAGGVSHVAEAYNECYFGQKPHEFNVSSELEIYSLRALADGRVVGDLMAPPIAGRHLAESAQELPLTVQISGQDISVTFQAYATDGTVTTLVYISPETNATASLSPGSWHEVTFVHSGGKDALYVDEELVSCVSTSAVFTGEQTVRLGRSTFSGSLTAKDIVVYDGVYVPRSTQLVQPFTRDPGDVAFLLVMQTVLPDGPLMSYRQDILGSVVGNLINGLSHDGRAVVVYSPSGYSIYTSGGSVSGVPQINTGSTVEFGNFKGVVKAVENASDPECLLMSLKVPVFEGTVTCTLPCSSFIGVASGQGEYRMFFDGNTLRVGDTLTGQELSIAVEPKYSPVYHTGQTQVLATLGIEGFLHAGIRTSISNGVLLYSTALEVRIDDTDLVVTCQNEMKTYRNAWSIDTWISLVINVSNGDTYIEGVVQSTQDPAVTVSVPVTPAGLFSGPGVLVAGMIQVCENMYHDSMTGIVFHKGTEGLVQDYISGSRILVGSKTAYSDGRIDHSFSVNLPQEDVSHLLLPYSTGVYPSDNRPFMVDLGSVHHLSGVRVHMSKPVSVMNTWISPNGVTWSVHSAQPFVPYDGDARYIVVSHGDPDVVLHRIEVGALETYKPRDVPHLSYTTGRRQMDFSRGTDSRPVLFGLGGGNGQRLGTYARQGLYSHSWDLTGPLQYDGKVTEAVSGVGTSDVLQESDVTHQGSTRSFLLTADSLSVDPSLYEFDMESGASVEIDGMIFN
jgi:hypothetical protein